MRTALIKAARVLLWLIYAWVTVMLVLAAVATAPLSAGSGG